jgi:hypothetical protein
MTTTTTAAALGGDDLVIPAMLRGIGVAIDTLPVTLTQRGNVSSGVMQLIAVPAHPTWAGLRINHCDARLVWWLPRHILAAGLHTVATWEDVRVDPTPAEVRVTLAAAYDGDHDVTATAAWARVADALREACLAAPPKPRDEGLTARLDRFWAGRLLGGDRPCGV